MITYSGVEKVNEIMCQELSTENMGIWNLPYKALEKLHPK